MNKVHSTMEKHFGEIDVEALDLRNTYYYLELEDEVKNPSRVSSSWPA